MNILTIAKFTFKAGIIVNGVCAVVHMVYGNMVWGVLSIDGAMIALLLLENTERRERELAAEAKNGKV